MRMPWKESQKQISSEEFDLCWKYYMKKTSLTEQEFNDKISEIRERTGNRDSNTPRHQTFGTDKGDEEGCVTSD